MNTYSREEVRWYLILILAISAANPFIFFSNIDLRAVYDNLVLDITAAAAVIAALIVVARQRLARAKLVIAVHSYTFTLVAVGLILWLGAELIWTWYIFGLGILDPFPSEADVLWLLGYGFFAYSLYKILYGLLLVERTRTHSEQIMSTGERVKESIEYKRQQQHLIVIVMTVISVIIVLFSYVMAVASTAPSPDAIAKTALSPNFAISVAYPVLDIVLFVPTILILIRLRRSDVIFTHWILLAAFIVFEVIGDLGFAYSELIVSEKVGIQQTWIWDTFFNSAYICIAAALLWYNRFSITPTIQQQQVKPKKDG